VVAEAREAGVAGEQGLVKLIDDTYPFGERSHWPYKAWLAERAITLAALRGDVMKIRSLGERHRPLALPRPPLVPVPEIEAWLQGR